eukprot:TRINITY_DN3047_c0_g1_i1.p1 TRINITY_DN3047_c0_g1~~TRINITY_DN3047_c0_g1_i1.p1  ORF type:complete len:1455 (+),score=441.97 TRINITY_DN3047_c0_g1_i1:78-4442(+)
MEPAGPAAAGGGGSGGSRRQSAVDVLIEHGAHRGRLGSLEAVAAAVSPSDSNLQYSEDFETPGEAPVDPPAAATERRESAVGVLLEHSPQRGRLGSLERVAEAVPSQAASPSDSNLQYSEDFETPGEAPLPSRATPPQEGGRRESAMKVLLEHTPQRGRLDSLGRVAEAVESSAPQAALSDEYDDDFEETPVSPLSDAMPPVQSAAAPEAPKSSTSTVPMELPSAGSLPSRRRGPLTTQREASTPTLEGVAVVAGDASSCSSAPTTPAGGSQAEQAGQPASAATAPLPGLAHTFSILLSDGGGGGQGGNAEIYSIDIEGAQLIDSPRSPAPSNLSMSPAATPISTASAPARPLPGGLSWNMSPGEGSLRSVMSLKIPSRNATASPHATPRTASMHGVSPRPAGPLAREKAERTAALRGRLKKSVSTASMISRMTTAPKKEKRASHVPQASPPLDEPPAKTLSPEAAPIKRASTFKGRARGSTMKSPSSPRAADLDPGPGLSRKASALGAGELKRSGSMRMGTSEGLGVRKTRGGRRSYTLSPSDAPAHLQDQRKTSTYSTADGAGDADKRVPGRSAPMTKIRIDDIRTMEQKVEEKKKGIRSMEAKLETKRAQGERKRVQVELLEQHMARLNSEKCELDAEEARIGVNEMELEAVREAEQHTAAARRQVSLDLNAFEWAAECLERAKRLLKSRREAAATEEENWERVIGATHSRLDVQQEHLEESSQHADARQQELAAAQAAAAERSGGATVTPFEARLQSEQAKLEERQKDLVRRKLRLAQQQQEGEDNSRTIKEQTTLVEKVKRELKWVEQNYKTSREDMRKVHDEWYVERYSMEDDATTKEELEMSLRDTVRKATAVKRHVQQRWYDLNRDATNVRAEVASLRKQLAEYAEEHDKVGRREAELDVKEAVTAAEARRYNQMRKRMQLWQRGLSVAGGEVEAQEQALHPQREDMTAWLEELHWREKEVSGITLFGYDAEAGDKMAHTDNKEARRDAEQPVDVVQGLITTHAENAKQAYLESLSLTRFKKRPVHGPRAASARSGRARSATGQRRAVAPPTEPASLTWHSQEAATEPAVHPSGVEEKAGAVVSPGLLSLTMTMTHPTTPVPMSSSDGSESYRETPGTILSLPPTLPASSPLSFEEGPLAPPLQDTTPTTATSAGDSVAAEPVDPVDDAPPSPQTGHPAFDSMPLETLLSTFGSVMGKLRAFDPNAAPSGEAAADAAYTERFAPEEIAALQESVQRERAVRMKLRTLAHVGNCPLDAPPSGGAHEDRALYLKLTCWWRTARAGLLKRAAEVAAERRALLGKQLDLLTRKCPFVGDAMQQPATGADVTAKLGLLRDTGDLAEAPAGDTAAPMRAIAKGYVETLRGGGARPGTAPAARNAPLLLTTSMPSTAAGKTLPPQKASLVRWTGTPVRATAAARPRPATSGTRKAAPPRPSSGLPRYLEAQYI